jgi:selenocysteine lyase/cysteine desulfurase
VTAAEFRRLFPACERYVWLDTPACPPAARPVADALGAAIAGWRDGDFSWAEWDAAREDCRALFARLIGVEDADVALIGSAGEAAATVARSMPPGDVVISNLEYRSNLFPFAAAADDSERRLVRAPASAAGVRAEDLIAAITPRTTMVVVSDVLSQDGHHVDLAAVRLAADAVGAALFVDATQSLGVLRFDLEQVRPDYLVVHGYKWMLCPRGAAWLVARGDRRDALRPLMPNVQSDARGGYFGGELQPWPTAARCDTSPAWLSWVGARAALELLLELPAELVESHCLALAARFREGAAALGARPLDDGRGSQIVSVAVRDARAAEGALAARGVRALAMSGRVRVGFHYFNIESDADLALSALKEVT